MLTETDELAELFKGYFPYYLLVFIPLFIIISPVSPVSASHEFPAYRMTQYDLNGVVHGCRASQVNLEARALRHSVTQRHCVISRLSNLSVKEVSRIRQYAGGLLIVLPEDFDSLSDEAKETIREVEISLLEDEVPIPVYFTPWSSDIENVLNDIESSELADDKRTSSLEAIFNAVSANGYLVFINAHKPSAKSDATITSIQGKLSGYGVEEKLPTIAIVTYYDAFSIAPELVMGGDGNASGLVAFLELIRIFSGLYSQARSHAQYNVLFLLSGGGKFNYQGSKKWLEDQLDGLESSLLQEAAFVLCLDGVSGDELFLHVSKPPREGSPAYQFYQELREASADVSLLHKKINLAEELFAWEHERFSMRRLPAFTLSSVRSFKDPLRRTQFDSTPVNSTKVARNTNLIASALARVLYNMSAEMRLPLSSDSELVRSWSDFFPSVPRSAILLSDKNNPLLKLLHDYMNRYLRNTKYSLHSADKRDPEFVFYDTTKTIVNLYNVKPAVFDLFISFLIINYLVVFYLLIQNFEFIFSLFCPHIDKKVKYH